MEMVLVGVDIAVREQPNEVEAFAPHQVLPDLTLKGLSRFQTGLHKTCALFHHTACTNRVVAHLRIANVLVAWETNRGSMRLKRPAQPTAKKPIEVRCFSEVNCISFIERAQANSVKDAQDHRARACRVDSLHVCHRFS